MPKQRDNLEQTSIRLSPGDIDEIKEMATKRGVPYSSVIRSAWRLYSWATTLPKSKKLVAVDVRSNDVVEIPIFDAED